MAPSQAGLQNVAKHFGYVAAEDHKPASEIERSRIMAAGGFLSDIGGVTRVNGNLNLSRAIGDLKYKGNRWDWVLGSSAIALMSQFPRRWRAGQLATMSSPSAWSPHKPLVVECRACGALSCSHPLQKQKGTHASCGQSAVHLLQTSALMAITSTQTQQLLLRADIQGLNHCGGASQPRLEVITGLPDPSHAQQDSVLPPAELARRCPFP